MTHRYRSAALCACLSLSVASCAGQPKLLTEYRTERTEVPAFLTAPTETPPYDAETFGEHLELILGLYGAINECNGDKARIREWSAD